MSDQYLVWSHEHTAWWMPGSRGYTKRVYLAGRYSRAEAIAICRGVGGWPDRHAPDEIPVLERDALDCMP